MPRRVRHLVAAITTAAVVVVAGCGDSATSTPTTQSGPIDTTGAVNIEVGYAGGSITGGGKRTVALGQAVVIKVTSDVTDEIHLHGYDKKANAGPGMVATIIFIADTPGVFEVELENKGLHLFDLEVK